MTWWIVSGCGSAEANGRYYQGDDVKNDYGESYRIYYQQNGSCSLEYEYYDGRWTLKSGSTTLYRNDNMEYYNGDPSQCTSWVVDSGVEPVPTIAKETTTGNGWNGKKYDTETGEVYDTVTELTYKYNPPKIGKFYTADGVIGCDVTAGGGLVFSCSLASAEAVRAAGLQPTGTVIYGTVDGMECATFDRSSNLTGSDVGLPVGNSPRTMTAWVKATNTDLSKYMIFFAYGSNNNLQRCSLCLERNTAYAGISMYASELFSSVVANSWTMITLTYTNSIIKVYVNGVLTNEGETTINTVTNGNTLRIGTEISESVPFAGSIAHARIYSRALTDEEVLALYNKQKPQA